MVRLSPLVCTDAATRRCDKTLAVHVIDFGREEV